MFPPNWPRSVGFYPKLPFNIHVSFMSAYWVRQQLLRPKSEIDVFGFTCDQGLRRFDVTQLSAAPICAQVSVGHTLAKMQNMTLSVWRK
jgi:hypothetical protein